MPSVLLTNANHLLNKMEEMSLLTESICPSVIAVTETWLSSNIPDSAIFLRNYSFARRDRTVGSGGGVLLYVRNDIHYRGLSQFQADDFEVVWLALRPKVLPRPFGLLIVSVIYCPPWYCADRKRQLADYIIRTVDSLSRNCPSAAYILCGDFNTLDVSLFNKYLHFKQVVSSATRGKNILDKIFLNCDRFYPPAADILPPIGKSDHNIVLLHPKSAINIPPVGWRFVCKRNIDTATVDAIGAKLAVADWRQMYYMNDVQQQTDYFYSLVLEVVDLIAPVCEYRFKNNDKQWVSPYFKKVVLERDQAYLCGNSVLYKKLRNKVNHLRANLKKDFYFRHLDSFKVTNPSKWWKTIKSLCGLSSCTPGSVFCNIHYNNEQIDCVLLADVINDFFISCASGVPAIEESVIQNMRLNLGQVPDEYIVSEFSVFDALSKLKVNKALGADGLPNKLLRGLAEVLAAPLCAIINSSVRNGVIPKQWKHARVTPIPKAFPPINVESDLRPISITSSLSKIAESYMCKFFNAHFQQHLDFDQFGCTAGRSTVLALVKICHYLFTAMDSRDIFGRILFVDFTKAFDLIDHNILFQKMCELDFAPHIIVWFLSFLVNRTQFVSLGTSFSECKITNAGTPQGTLSGPNDFKLMINDLMFDLAYIKYVDDTTVASVSCDPLDESLQRAADHLLDWCAKNGMRLNSSKTKEMVIYFGKKFPVTAVPPINIDGTVIERVSTFKLLGVVFNSQLTWHDHVNYILSKVSKRMYYISQLVKSGVKDSNVIEIYCSVIRSVLEYCCPVWHPGVTVQQSHDIERVQKRCLRIVYPNLSYNTAMQISGLETLFARREKITRELFGEVKKPGHILNGLLSQRVNIPNLRHPYTFQRPVFKTGRCRRDFITYCLLKKY